MASSAPPPEHGGGSCLSCTFAHVALHCPSRVALIQAHLKLPSPIFHHSQESPSSPPHLPYSADGSSASSAPCDPTFTYSQLLRMVDSLASCVRESVSHRREGCFSSSSPAPPSACPADDGERVRNVGLFMVPSVEYVVAVLAVLRCGFAFVPLDPFWPLQRVVEVVHDSDACLILTREQMRGGPSFHSLKSSVKIPSLLVDLASITKNFDDTELCGSDVCPCFCHGKQRRRYCYIMYTSGSTAKPKGVCGTEAGLLHRLQWMQQEYPFLEDDVAIFKTSTAFIDHLTELFGPLLGSSLVVVPPFEDLFRNPLALLSYLQTYHVTRVTAVPSWMRAALPVLQGQATSKALLSVRVLVLSGEVLLHELLQSVQLLLPNAIILNLYGSTEVSGDCFHFNCGTLERNWDYLSVPIGKPLPGCVFHLLSENELNENEGELLVGGILVALGYYNDSGRTVERFMNGTSPDNDTCFFKTGDYVKKLNDRDDLLYLGRKDRTVKVAGHKVVLEEIESILQMHPLVDQAAVTFHVRANSDHNIVAHVVLDSGKDAKTNTELNAHLRSWLTERLPLSAVPHLFQFIDALPVLVSGKVDYQALSMSRSSRFGSPIVEENTTMMHIKQVFEHVLKMENISIHDDFFSLGGTSVSAAHAAYILGTDIRILYFHSSPMSLAPVLEAQQKEHNTSQSSELLNLERRKRLKIGTLSSMPKLQVARDLRSKGTIIEDDQAWPHVQVLEPLLVLRCNLHPFPSHTLIKDGTHKVFLHSTSVKSFSVPSILWKLQLKACIDASPLMLISKHQCHLFIGSHAHNFVCIDAHSGTLIWETVVGGRVESSAGITIDLHQVMVGCYDGCLYFLERGTGIVKWKFQTNAEVKCQPTVDIKNGHIWCGSHDHNLYVLDAVNECCVWKMDCNASIFAPPVHDSSRALVYIATTGGTLIAISSHSHPPEIMWTYSCGAPIFGSPTIETNLGYVICASVNGSVLALTSNGLLAWQYKTSGPIFAAPCLSTALPLQILVCSRDGCVYSLNVSDGSCLWSYNLGEPITSAAFVDEILELVFREYRECNMHLHSFRLVCVCGSGGQVHVLKVYAGVGTSAVDNDEQSGSPGLSSKIGLSSKMKEAIEKSVLKEKSLPSTETSVIKAFELVAILKLPGDVFSSPIMLDGRIFVGCRDDHLYCLIVPELNT